MAHTTAQNVQNNNQNRDNTQNRNNGNRNNSRRRNVNNRNAAPGQDDVQKREQRQKEYQKQLESLNRSMFLFFQRFSDFEDDAIETARKRELQRKRAEKIKRRDELRAKLATLRKARQEREKAQKAPENGAKNAEAESKQETVPGDQRVPKAEEITADLDAMLAELDAQKTQTAQEGKNEEPVDLDAMIAELTGENPVSQEALKSTQEVQSPSAQEAQEKTQEQTKAEEDAELERLIADLNASAKNAVQKAEDQSEQNEANLSGEGTEIEHVSEEANQPDQKEEGQPEQNAESGAEQAGGPVEEQVEKEAEQAGGPVEEQVEKQAEQELTEKIEEKDQEIKLLDDEEQMLDQMSPADAELRLEILQKADEVQEDTDNEYEMLEEEIRAEERGEKPAELSEEELNSQVEEIEAELDGKKDSRVEEIEAELDNEKNSNLSAGDLGEDKGEPVTSTDSMSSGYNEIILETIFGGMKENMLKKKEDGGVGDDVRADMMKTAVSEEFENEMRQWMDNYMTGCLVKNEDTFRMILRSVRRTTKDADSGLIRDSVKEMLCDTYLDPVLKSNSIMMAQSKITRLTDSLVDEGSTAFGRRLKALIEDIMKEM